MSEAFTHGFGSCRECFSGNEETMSLGDWRLHNIPTYSGSAAPEILVVGFSKGANQTKAAETGDFDKVAFAGARDRLGQVLDKLDVLPRDRGIDALFTASEPRFGFASLVRCSFCKMKGGSCKTSGDVVPTAFTNPQTRAIIQRCASKYLGRLPAGLRLVLLLGTSESYIARTKDLFRTLYRDFRETNPVAFTAGGALWVYATHPSPGNGHFNSWISKGPDDGSGRKRILAQDAVRTLGL